MYVYIHVRHVCMRIHLSMYMKADVDTYADRHTKTGTIEHTRVLASVLINLHLHSNIHTYYTYACMHLYIRRRIRVCICIWVGFRSGFCGSGWVKVQVQVLFLGFRLDQGLAFGVLVRLKLGSGLVQVWHLGSGWV